MKRILFLLVLAISAVLNTWAENVPICASTADHPVVYNVYSVASPTYYWNQRTGATTSVKGNFIFEAQGTPNCFYIYNVDTEQYVGYTPAASYSSGRDFAAVGVKQPWYFRYDATNKNYSISPLTSSSAVAAIYMNWNSGPAYNMGETSTMGLWNGSETNTGNRWGFEMADDPSVLHIATNSTVGPDILTDLVAGQQTFTTNAYSGKSGLTMTLSGGSFQMYTHKGASCLGIKTSSRKTTNTITINAPSGYVITGYEIGGYQFTSSESYTLTASQGAGITTATINSTTESGITPSLNVTDLFLKEVSFRITTNNSTNNWYMLVPWLKFYLERVAHPADLIDGSVYSISCVYSDGTYPLFNDNGTPSISTSIDTAPQLFVFRNNGSSNDVSFWNLQKAEGDGKYLSYATSDKKPSSFSTTPSTYLFVNASTNLPTGASAVGTRVGEPYVHFTGMHGNTFYPSFRGPYAAGTLAFDAKDDAGNGNIYGTTTATAARTSGSTYSYRWILKPEPYTVYNLVVQDAGGTAVNDARVRYYNPNDATIEHAAQQNGGFFVIKNGVTPVQSMFSLQDNPLYKITSVSIVSTTITVTVASLAVTAITEGRYVIRNNGRTTKQYLTQSGDVIEGNPNLGAHGASADFWYVVPTETSGQYFIRNEADNRYIKMAPNNLYGAFTLVESAADATRVTFSTASDDVTVSGCVAIKIVDTTGEPYEGYRLFHMAAGGSLVRWIKDACSDWLFYPAEPKPVVGEDYLLLETRHAKYATRGADDNAQVVQNAKGYLDVANSVWTFTASGDGYKIGNGGTANLLNDPRGTANSTSAFTASGVTWYIQHSPHTYSYYSISSNVDPTQYSCLNDGGGGANVTIWYGNDEGSCWRFITPEVYYLNALAYLECIYDVNHKNDLFYISQAGYEELKAATHDTTAKMIAIANSIYTRDPNYFNMPEDGKDYLIKNLGLQVILGQNRYLYTNESTLVLKDAPYNSTYFWHVERGATNEYYLSQCCYDPSYSGTDPLQYGEDKRYIAGSQPAQGSGSLWDYTDTKPTGNPVSFDFYSTNEIPYFGSASMIVGGNRMNGNTYNVITWNSQDNNCKWQFITVEEASASLIATAETAVAVARANAGAAFTLTAEVIDDIEDAIEALESTPTYVNYYILEQLLKDHTNYYWLANGRYLVRNYEFDPDGDGNVNDTETYLTSLINPEGVVEDAIGYWSIWDITNVGLGQYSVVNEGNKFILAPGTQLDGNPNTDERNDGYLFYDTTKNAYQVGDPTVSDESTLYFYPAAEVSAILPASDVVSGDFAAISVPSQVTQGKYMNMFTQSDHVASYSMSPTARRGCFWQFIPISSANETNHEGTHSGEAEMFANQVNGLAGYVGGVVTLENVESVPCLNDIVLLRNAAVTALDGGTALSFTNSPYEAVDINQGDNVGAKAFRAILDRIHDIKDGKEPDGSTNNDLKKYYQDLRPTEVVNEANVYHPFFLENMSGQRPEFGARLAQTSETGYWRCVRQVEANDNLSVFYVRRNGAVGDNATYWLRNGEKTGVGNFLKHGTMSQNDEVEYVAHNATDSNGDGIPDDALEFKIDPVIPGVWQMYDVGAGSGPSRYLTITGTGPTIAGHNYTIQYYNKSETSTLWKFKTFNDLDKIYLRPGPETGGMNFFCTFSYPLNITLPKAGNPTPYYCSAAYRSRGGTNAALKVVFEVVPDDGTNYYLKGNEGYMFMSEDATGLNIVNDASDEHNGYVYIDDAQFLSGGIPTTLLPNSMKANLNTTYVTSENWARIYALGNVSTSTQVGSYHGTPVYGIGMGFYHVKIGGKLNPNTAYIPRERFTGVDDEELPSYSIKEMSESGIPAEIVFKDEYGIIVDQIEVLPDGTMQRTADGPVYDLAGRRVTKPMRGIYIQNGRKVMYK